MLTSILSCSAVLAHIILREKLHIFGILGCVLCVVGSTTIVLHAPQEREIQSVIEVWDLATEPGNISLGYPLFHSSSMSYNFHLFTYILYMIGLDDFTFFYLFHAAFLFYAALVITAVFVLIIHFIPQYGQTHIMVYIGVCSLVGSLSVRIGIW